MLIRADASRIPLPSRSVHAVVTSPPYLEQRWYGDHPLEGGHEGTLEQYVAWLAGVFDELARVMRPDGLAWLNIGDKANGSGGAGGDWTRPDVRARRDPMGGAKRFLDVAYPDRSFLDVGGAVVRELLHRGWRLRSEITWDKGRNAPESLRHAGRPGISSEKIYLLAPGPPPVFELDGTRRFTGRTSIRPRFFSSMLEETGSVWHFKPGGSGPAHLAPFPDELARRCILPSTLPGDLVLDPFDGSGTTRRVAEAHGRHGIGLDLYAGIQRRKGRSLLGTNPQPSTSTTSRDNMIPDPQPQVEALA